MSVANSLGHPSLISPQIRSHTLHRTEPVCRAVAEREQTALCPSPSPEKCLVCFLWGGGACGCSLRPGALECSPAPVTYWLCALGPRLPFPASVK